MKSILTVLVTLVVSQSILIGCGGGGSSSTLAEASNSPDNQASPSSPPDNQASPNSPPPENNLANSININPMRDLGLDQGKSACFKIKSYNNIGESEFSDAICGQVKNEQSLTLTWEDASGNVVGYYVYFGTNKDKAGDNFLADVIES